MSDRSPNDFGFELSRKATTCIAIKKNTTIMMALEWSFVAPEACRAGATSRYVALRGLLEH